MTIASVIKCHVLVDVMIQVIQTEVTEYMFIRIDVLLTMFSKLKPYRNNKVNNYSFASAFFL